MRVDDLEGSRADYLAALTIFREIHARLGEANTLQTLGDLKMRVDDLEGSRADYLAALTIYREIHARLGEANCRQGIGSLLLAQNRPDEAFKEFAEAQRIHKEIHDELGVAGDFGYMGRSAAAAGNHAPAVILFESAIGILRQIVDRGSEALVLQDQGEAFQQLGMRPAAFAALWQARHLFRQIGSSKAKALEPALKRLQAKIAGRDRATPIPDDWDKAEAIRTDGVRSVRKTTGDQVSGHGTPGEPGRRARKRARKARERRR
jgi:tetratricopeptide (TPR) repeat protein